MGGGVTLPAPTPTADILTDINRRRESFFSLLRICASLKTLQYMCNACPGIFVLP